MRYATAGSWYTWHLFRTMPSSFSGGFRFPSARWLVWRCGAAFAALWAAGSASALAPSGIAVEARLLTPISSYSSKAGMPLAAEIMTPLCVGGGAPLPVGATIFGTLKRVHRVGIGLIHETAGMQFQFRDLQLPDGRDYPVEAELTGIDNARERVDRHGDIHGIRATATLSNRFGERLEFAARADPDLWIPLFIVEAGVFRFPDPEIEYRRGTELELSVKLPDALGLVSHCAMPAPQLSAGQWKQMQEIVNDLPFWTFSVRQHRPLDLVNLLFIGSEDEVQRAFQAAGWDGSLPNSPRAGMNAIRAIVRQAGFEDAPMRTLLLDGAPPDIRLQKSLNTFEKRDHLRIWKRSGRLEDREVWASAATRDLAVTFDLHPFGFTHRIQGNVDLEREKVVNDLMFTGCVDSVTYLRRPANLVAPGASYRKGVETDERVAVLLLNSCHGARIEEPARPGAFQPGTTVRVLRRVILTARNHFLRDNLIWRSGDAARLTFLAVRQWDRQRREDHRAYRREIVLQSSAPSPPPAP